jgi:aryl-alcohol dehydrogenase-like predicted oxidoreductase
VGVDEALRLLRTDRIDVVHLHSCPLEVLERGEVIDALERAVEAGKVRVAAYSGDNEPLEWAVDSGRFGGVQTSINLFDQWAVERGLARAAAAGMTVIAKRPLANAPWRFAERPAGDYAEVYWERMRAMGLDPGDLSWDELALRWVAFLPGVSSCIVGTRRLENLRRNVEIVSRGPLPADVAAAVRSAFLAHGSDWRGEV